MSDILLLPGDPGFNETLALSPPPWIPDSETGNTFVMGADGLLRGADSNSLTEYLEGGEYDEVMGDFFFFEDDEDEPW